MEDTEFLQLTETLASSRFDLPFELVSVLQHDDPSFNEVVLYSAKHIERVFMFSKFLERDAGSIDDEIRELKIDLELASYYAAMSLPLARQLLEPIDTFLYSKNKLSADYGSWGELSLEVGAEGLVEKGKCIARNIEQLSKDYETIGDPIQLQDWCVFYLRACGEILMLASSLAMYLRSES